MAWAASRPPCIVVRTKSITSVRRRRRMKRRAGVQDIEFVPVRERAVVLPGLRLAVK
jgi:hypothetical protein